MKKIILSILAISIITTLLFSFQVRDNMSDNKPVIEFLDSLDEQQLAQANFPFDDSFRTRWHFFPITMWRRKGILMRDLNEKQRDISSRMLMKYLSKSGYAKTKKIIALETILAEIEDDTISRDPEIYFITIYGNPRKDSVWAWSFEGHHLSLNFTIVDNKISASPRFLGANPTPIQSGKRKGDRTLAEEEDLAYAFMHKLTRQQKQKAIFSDISFFDNFTSNKSEVSPLDPVGIQTTELNSMQKNNLKDLIALYLSSLPDEIALERENKILQEEFDEIRFAWAGGLKENKAHYYRIQGQSFLIEFANIQDNATHIHTVWRDFNGDFGRDLIKEHYLSQHIKSGG